MRNINTTCVTIDLGQEFPKGSQMDPFGSRWKILLWVYYGSMINVSILKFLSFLRIVPNNNISFNMYKYHRFTYAPNAAVGRILKIKSMFK